LKRFATVTVLVLALAAGAFAQNPVIPPFYQVYGGLFYPAQKDHRATFGSPSDFVWGMGMGLPVSADFLYLVAEMSWFETKAVVPGTPDTDIALSQKFMHLGLMNKYFLAPTLAVRIQGGLNYNAVEMTSTPVGGTAVKTELGRKFGFFGGLGVENMLAGGRMAVFVDGMYDYRRSVEREMYGDVGGIRVVGGLSLYWF